MSSPIKQPDSNYSELYNLLLDKTKSPKDLNEHEALGLAKWMFTYKPHSEVFPDISATLSGASITSLNQFKGTFQSPISKRLPISPSFPSLREREPWSLPASAKKLDFSSSNVEQQGSVGSGESRRCDTSLDIGPNDPIRTPLFSDKCENGDEQESISFLKGGLMIAGALTIYAVVIHPFFKKWYQNMQKSS